MKTSSLSARKTSRYRTHCERQESNLNCAFNVGFLSELGRVGVPYDELIHAFTTFSVSLTFYFLFYRGAVPEGRAIALGTSVFTLGVTVGAYGEIFEWFFVGKYTMADTISDLLVDSGRPGSGARGAWPAPIRGSSYIEHLLGPISQNAPWTNLRRCEVALLGHRSRSARH
jgi:hypothetical protein